VLKMNLKNQKALAADILKVGVSRVYIDPTRLEDVSMAIRREDIKRLIHDGFIKKKPEKGISHGRARKVRKKRKLGRRRGYGTRSGRKTARLPRKRRWIQKIRPIRKKLKMLRARRMISPATYRMLYRKAKGNSFRSVAHLETYVDEHELYRR
jgi:large subunit ribosomal protein L19e